MVNFRKFVFLLKDALEGGQIRNSQDKIRHGIINPTSNNVTKDISKLLRHAVESVDNYKTVISSNLSDFNVTNKTKLKDVLEGVLSKKFKGKKLISMTTSGSTGTPFTVYQDKGKKIRNHADTLFFANMAGYELGHRLLYFKIWAKEKLSHPFLYWLQNIVPIDVIKLDESVIRKVLEDIKEHVGETHAVLGYVSALEQVVHYCEKHGIDDLGAKFSSVITMSESLNIETKEKLEKLFNCPVVSRYSNLENGIIAQQEVNGDGSFLINTASYYVEILDLERDEILPEGHKGRIVVTDLYNYAMPMIRYDTGDIGSMYIAPNGKKYLKTVEGRKLDVLYDTHGNIVSSYIMYKNMWKYTEISQYQLIQIGEKDYLFKINCPNSFDKESQLVTEFKEYLGEDSNFQVEYVTEIPLLNSGKRRKTVNLYRKD